MSALSTQTAPGAGAGLSEWLAFHQRLNPRRIELGLERTLAVLASLDLARPELVISVAGTNGKGSTVAMLDGLLRSDRGSIGTFTSPHLVRYNERIAIDGQPVDDAVVIDAFQRIEEARGDVLLTFFEASTLAALVVFDAARVETTILEVGLGGRLDAVNAVHADGMIVTSIDLDHQQWLGDTREAIGREKAGILRAGRPAVFSGPDMPQSVAAFADDHGVPLWVAGRDYDVEIGGDGRWRYASATLTLIGLPPPGLAGRHQIDNAAGALALLERLGRVPTDAGERLASVRLRGRFQRAARDPDWFVDVAHNPASAVVLADNLAATPCAGRTFAIVGMLAEKDVESTIGAAADVIDVWNAVPAVSTRGLTAQPVAQRVAAVTGSPCAWFDTLEDAMTAVRGELGPADRAVVFGSFRVAGPALELLGL